MEDTRAVWRWRLADELSQDVRYALRTFRRQPGFAVVVVPTLALGIGANTAIFSLFEAIMLRGWPCTSRSSSTSSRTVPGASLHPRTIRTTSACADRRVYRRHLLLEATFRVAAGDGVEMTRGQFVSGNYHAVLGVPMAIGRGFTAENDRDGAGTLVAVISDGYWTRKFGRDPQVLGQTLTIDGRALSIVGVTAAGFGGLDPTRVDITPSCRADARRTGLADRSRDVAGRHADRGPRQVRRRTERAALSMPRSSSFSPSRPMSGCVSCPDGTLSARR